MASRGNTGVQKRWSPGLVPGADGDEVLVECASVRVLEAAHRTAGVEDRGVVDQAVVPFPSSSRWLFRRVRTING